MEKYDNKFESKLRVAYVRKERTEQMAENQALKFDSYLEDAEIARRMHSETDKAEEDRRKREIIRQEEMKHYKQDLQHRLKERELSKQKAYEEFLREKLVIDEIARKIYEEDQRETERKLEHQRAMRDFIAGFKSKREQWKKKIVVLKTEKRAQEDALDRVQPGLAEQIKRDRDEREEQALQRLERNELEARIRQRLELQRERDEQM
ncbi:unnamed protein product [Adineta ricciae]|uniref:Meiosis-specific nuclear structural protein 1 n=1 Tax=Adineta ricciae TaxID=249248 RepID=A0A815VZ25_ADIRI|nr:unnamed protein product [Adineta ricciae]